MDDFESGGTSAARDAAKQNMLIGALWCAGGTAVTLVTLSSGGRGIIAWGAILYGGIRFVRGLIAMR